MKPRCTICNASFREKVDADLHAGMPATKVAKLWGFSPEAVRRHRSAHLTAKGDAKLEAKRRREREAKEKELADRAAALFADFETLLRHRDGFGLDTATPVQRAIARLSDGQPLDELAFDPEVIEAFGDPAEWPEPGQPPHEVGIICAVRTGKSLIAAAKAVYATQTVECFQLGPGEIPRVSVMSLRTDLADVLLDHIKGHIRESEVLKSLLISEDKDTIVLRHPTGRPIEIQVVAGSRAGSSVVARWCAGLILDEAPRMNGADSSVINFEDVVHATQGRLLPGAQIFYIGSPWVPSGPVYELVKVHFGKPSGERVICWARGPLMNPFWWTLERCADLERRDPIAYQTDVLAQFTVTSEGLFPPEILLPCIRSGERIIAPVDQGCYVAAMDPATRRDAWALVITRRDTDIVQVVYLRQWRGSPKQPLSPDTVLGEIRAICAAYRVFSVWTDQYSSDAIRDIAIGKGLGVMIETTTVLRNVQRFDHLHTLAATGRLDVPDDPDLVTDLKRVRKVATQNGVTIVMPRVAGRHCDYASALALAISRPVVGSMWADMIGVRQGIGALRTCPGLTDWGEMAGLQNW